MEGIGNKKKKVLFVATVVKTHINVFHLPYLKMFHEQGYEVHVAAKNDFVNEPCIIPNCDVYYNISFARFPFNSANIKAYYKLKKIIGNNQYDIIHCHTPVASVLTRLAARKCRNTTVIYTAHGLHFYKGAPIMNWLIFYPVERFCARYTDKLIVINKEDYARTKKFKLRNNGKVYYVPGVGVNLEKYQDVRINRDIKRKELGVADNTPIILSVGELIKRKNHEMTIRALGEIKDQKFIYLICGKGPLLEYLKALSQNLGIVDKVIFLGFRRDIPEICKASDIFLFPSYQEGLPVAVMEAMAAGLPVICSAIRGNIDLVENEKNGFVCSVKSTNSYIVNIKKLLSNSTLRKKIATENYYKSRYFDLITIKNQMKLIYGDKFLRNQYKI